LFLPNDSLKESFSRFSRAHDPHCMKRHADHKFFKENVIARRVS